MDPRPLRIAPISEHASPIADRIANVRPVGEPMPRPVHGLAPAPGVPPQPVATLRSRLPGAHA